MSDDSPPADPLIGRTLGGHYRIEAPLGRGAMGVVYRARHTLLDQPFAVKVLSQGVGADAEVRRRFLLEAKSLTYFTHKHAVQVRHLGEEGGLLYLAMDLVPGETLAALLARERPLPEPRAAAIALQILDALDEAHRAGIVHRDLKPGNVMVETARADAFPAGDRDRVRVLDFGLARIVDAERTALPGAFASTGGNVVGTVAYMSPEQLRAEEGVDGRSDVFSVGVVLYEMLTGRLPFEGKSTMSIALGILEREPAPLESAAAPAVSPPMRAVLVRALAKSPARRFPTAGAFADALRGALAGDAPPPPPPEPTPSVAAAPGSARRRALAAVVVAAVLLAAAGAFLLLRGGGGERDRAAGEAAFLDGRFAEAAEAYGRLVAAGKATPEDRLHRAEARIELLEPEAATDLDAASAGLPQDPRVSLLAARFAWRVRKPRDAARAEQALIEALTRDGDFVEARAERVRQRLDAGRLADATADIQILERSKAAPGLALTLRSRMQEVRIDRREVPLSTASVAEAVALAERAAEADPRDADAAEQEANALSSFALEARRTGEHELARTSFDRSEKAGGEAIRRALADRAYRRQGSRLGRYHTDRGMQREQRDDLEGANADYAEALKRNPLDARARELSVYATRFLEPEKAMREAQALFDATGQYDHLFDVAFARQTMGTTKADVGDVAGAREEFRRAIEAYGEGARLAPDFAAFTTYRGETHVLRARLAPGPGREEDLAAALEDFRRSLRGVRGDSEVLLRRAAAHTLRGDTEKALADLETAVGDDRGMTPRYYQELARALLAQAEVDAAAGRREKALERLGRVAPLLEIALARMPEVRPKALPLLATAEARAAALVAAAEREPRLARARGFVSELVAAADRAADGGPRLRASAARANAEIAQATGDAAGAAAAAGEAVAIRDRENQAKRWSLDGAWLDRLAAYLDAAGRPEEARAARERGAAMPR